MNNLEKLSISICLPIYNEAKSINFVIDEWVNLMNKLSLDYKIICSEDGSIDGTKEILKEKKLPILHTNKGNSAIPLYEKLGYKLTRDMNWWLFRGK